VDGAVPVKWAKNEGSCLVPFGPMLAKHEHLKVSLGQIRMLPFAVEDGRLILDLQHWKLDDSVPRKRLQAARARWARLSTEQKQAAIDRARAKMLRAQRRFFEALVKKKR
ncbi:MAG TPA: hypothetical protein VK191_17965, partial [Symbiobacteriaceae bacterium]|nr:hypothetical protein [Symbiobacteriaceae bacterium]